VTSETSVIAGDSLHTMDEGRSPVGKEYSGGRLITFPLKKIINHIH